MAWQENRDCACRPKPCRTYPLRFIGHIQILKTLTDVDVTRNASANLAASMFDIYAVIQQRITDRCSAVHLKRPHQEQSQGGARQLQ